MKKYLTRLLGLCILFLPVFVFANSQVPGKPNLTVLFIQNSEKGTLTPIKGKQGYYQLELKGVREYTAFFSDRPARITGLYPTQKFVDNWDHNHRANSFNKIPPNVALTGIKSGLFHNQIANIILQLSNPVYSPKEQKLVYTAHLLSGEKAPESLKTLNHVVLFIDSFCASCVSSGF